jgi:hypothetical protein
MVICHRHRAKTVPVLFPMKPCSVDGLFTHRETDRAGGSGALRTKLGPFCGARPDCYCVICADDSSAADSRAMFSSVCCGY